MLTEAGHYPVTLHSPSAPTTSLDDLTRHLQGKSSQVPEEGNAKNLGTIRFAARGIVAGNGMLSHKTAREKFNQYFT